MPTITFGVDRDVDGEFRAFAQSLGLGDIVSEPSSSAGDLEINIVKIVLDSPFAWGALLGWLIAKGKYFEVFLDRIRAQLTQEDLKDVERYVRKQTPKLLARTQPSKKSPAKKRVHESQRKKK
jgi:hypothetical protein